MRSSQRGEKLSAELLAPKHSVLSSIAAPTQQRAREVIACGKTALSRTNVMGQGILFTKKEVEAAQQFVCQAAPTPENWPETGNHWNSLGGAAEHLQLCAQLNHEISRELQLRSQKVNPEKMVVVGLLHDLGRFVLHNFFVTDQLTDELAYQIGINISLLQAMHKIDWYWNVEEPIPDFKKITIEQRISAISDVLGKRHSQERHRLRQPHEVLEEVARGKIKYLEKPPTSSHDQRMHAIMPQYAERERYVLTHILDWLNDLDIQLDRIVMRVGKKLLG